METLWLELLLNLSFSMEGQQMILKISGRKTLVDSANVGGGGGGGGAGIFFVRIP